MAEQQYTQQQMRAIADQETRLPGMQKKSRRIVAVAPVPEPSIAPEHLIAHPVSKINVDEAIAWIASCDTLTGCPSIGGVWAAVQERLAQLGVKPNKFAVGNLPAGAASGTFNVGGLIQQIRKTELDGVEALQKLFAAMRLRFRAVNWYAKRMR